GESLTARYIQGKEQMPVVAARRRWSDFIEIQGARENNLKNLNVKFPLHVLTVVTGVSGSGKTSLVKQILYPALMKASGGYASGRSGAFDSLEGDIGTIQQVELVDQNPIGRSSRSNPATYVKAYDDIRQLFASRP